jgi:ABC-type transporter MlaC component
MSNGVKVVGAPVRQDGERSGQETTQPESTQPESTQPESTQPESTQPEGFAGSEGGQSDPPSSASPRSRSRAERSRSKGLVRATSVLAVLGLVGTAVFGVLWATASTSSPQDPTMTSAARSFLTDLTNFDAKTIDADFNSITSMATGTFSGQATKFFNSSIRTELQNALAESRGQIRNLYTQSDNGSQAAVYGVIDQVYVNNKISTPQSDVLRVVVNLQKVRGNWKISDVTVLEGATPASAGSASGSAGSTVPGQ